MDGTILGQGTFTASYTSANPNTGVASNQAANSTIIAIPSNADWVRVFNYTKSGAAGLNSVYFAGTANAFAGTEYYWQRGMAAGTGTVKYKANTTSVLNQDTMNSGGFTIYDPNNATVGALNNGSTGVSGFTAANPAVVTVGSTSSMVAGNTVIFTSLNNQPMYGGIPFSVGYGTLTTTTFSVDYLNSTSSTPSTTGNFRIRAYGPLYYPGRRFITSITTGSTTVITLSMDHGFTVGQSIRLSFVDPIWGTFTQLNGVQGTIIATDTAVGVGHNTITVNIDSTGLLGAGGFSFAGTFARISTTPFTPAEVIAVGEDTAYALTSSGIQIPLINGVQIPNTNTGILSDSTVNTAYLGMILGGGGVATALTTPVSGPAGTVHFTSANAIDAADVMYWVAGKSTYGGL